MTVQIWVYGSHWVFTDEKFCAMADRIPDDGIESLSEQEERKLLNRYGRRV